MWGCKQLARNADEWLKCWDLTVDDDSLSLLTRCRRVPLVHELLWLTVGWSKLANRAIRLDRSSSSIERTSVESSTTKHGWTYQKGRVRRQTLFFIIQQVQLLPVTSPTDFTCLRPQNYAVLFTTIVSQFVHTPYFLQKLFLNCLPWRHRLVMILWLNLQ